ncbi:MAG: dephospho-CoA kinase [Acidobacteriota bacterium]
MLKVGLTGSIATGKSFIVGVFRELGCFTLDADITARKVVEPGTAGLREIAVRFGTHVISADGSLDRAKMGAIVFNDASKREILNSIVHPLVIDSQDKWLAEQEKHDPNGIAVVDAALMIESGGYKRFNRLIVAWCEPDILLHRLMSRNGLSEEAAKKRIEAQIPQEQKKLYADFLIDTSKDHDDTRRQTVEIFHELELLK